MYLYYTMLNDNNYYKLQIYIINKINVILSKVTMTFAFILIAIISKAL